MSLRRFFKFKISWAWSMMSVACPWNPPDGWCIIMRAFGRANLRFLAPAASRSEPMDAACPMHSVDTAGRTNCMVSYTASPEVTTPPGELMYMAISFLGIVGLEKEQLRDNEGRHRVLDRTGDEDDSF